MTPRASYGYIGVIADSEGFALGRFFVGGEVKRSKRKDADAKGPTGSRRKNGTSKKEKTHKRSSDRVRRISKKEHR